MIRLSHIAHRACIALVAVALLTTTLPTVQLPPSTMPHALRDPSVQAMRYRQTPRRLRDDAAPASALMAQLESTHAGAEPFSNQFICDGDGVSGKRVEVIYVSAADQADRYDQSLDTIRGLVAEADTIIRDGAAETGGSRRLRFVTNATCDLVVQNVHLSPTGDDDMDHTVAELQAQGFDRTDRKYVVFVDAATDCHTRGRKLDNRPGAENENNTGPAYVRIGTGCWRSDILAHELLHALGAVYHTAPNGGNGSHTYDLGDLMGWTDVGNPIQELCPHTPYLDHMTERLDCNHDDYFNTNPTPGSYLATRWNVADNAFFVAEPAPPVPMTPMPDVLATSQHGGAIWAVAIAGAYLYLGVGSRLLILDVADPHTPSLIGASAPLPGIIHDLVVSGHYVYAATEGAGLRILDVADPAHPRLVGFVDTPGWTMAVAVAGTFAYVADGASGLRIIDVASPDHPIERGVFDTAGWASGVAISGTLAYVADGDQGLREIDIANPTAPVERRQQNLGLDNRGVVVVGNTVYVAERWGGLLVYTLECGPSITGICGIGAYSSQEGEAGALTIVGNTAYLAYGAGGMRIIDITDPSTPRLMGMYDTPGSVSDIAVAGHYAYVADRWDGLHIVDISTPAAPIAVGQYRPAGYVSNMTIQGTTTYVVDAGRLRILDIADPDHPFDLGFLEPPGWSTSDPWWLSSVAVSGTLALVSGTYGVGIVDIANAAHPTARWWSERDPASAGGMDVALSGHNAYIANQGRGLDIFDITTPITPTHLGSFTTPKPATAVAVVGAYAYVAAGTAGLLVVDVSQPITPLWWASMIRRGAPTMSPLSVSTPLSQMAATV